MSTRRIAYILSAAFALLFILFQIESRVDATPKPPVAVSRSGAEYILSSEKFGEVHRTLRPISDERVIQFPGSAATVITWQETAATGARSSFYAISTGGGKIQKVGRTDAEIHLKYADFDPLASVPDTPFELTARGSKRGAYIVQFITQPLDEYRQAITALGGKIYIYLPDHAYIVHLTEDERAAAEKLPFVRWIGRYEPAYKLDPELLGSLRFGDLGVRRYNIMMLERGPEMQERAASLIRASGGEVHTTTPEGFLLEATVDADLLASVMFGEDVLFIDEWSAPENDMNVVRSVGGANMIESTLGFRGEGVRAEVCDNGLRQTHNAFNSGLSPIIHNSSNTIESSNHGTSTYGINFGRGDGNSNGRGLLPEAQGIFADYDFLSNRYSHTRRLVEAPYNAVYQTNSWGGGLTTSYNTTSAQMDDITFLYDIVILNSQSNTGNRLSRPQAWAKNVVSVGGVRHFNTASFDDDRWDGGASIGPAADGRLKPDLAYFYDSILTTNNSGNSSYTSGFGGTSAATPMTAGFFGIFFQMWHEGLFGNPTNATVFESRPQMSTAKAMMINSAIQWNMSSSDISRVVQGWGRANVENLYDLRNKMLIIDEADPLTVLQTRSYQVFVPQASADPLKVTMVFTDPMGNPSSSLARINDLSLKVTSPTGTVYWGNYGLGVGEGMWSVSGGNENKVDTVENVFIQNPQSGYWMIEVIASEINADGRPETQAFDADFALVASGILRASPTSAPVTAKGRVVNEFGAGVPGVVVSITDPNGIIQTFRTGSFGHYEFTGLPAGESYVISARSGRYSFEPPAIVRTLNDDASGIDFTAFEPNAVRGSRQ